MDKLIRRLLPPIILNTGAAGYSSSTNSTASTTYASEGYINVACGNRGKQDTATDSDGNAYYTGDAPCRLVDQKNAARFAKYNILLGNLPGNVDYLVSTGGSGGGAHASMFVLTSNNSDFYPYEVEAGAVGVYATEDGYTTTITIDNEDYELSDGAWGCIAYSAITPLYEADIALGFEYYLDTTYEFNTALQTKLAEYLASTYMDYINNQNLSIDESLIGFDLDNDGELKSNIDLTIEYDENTYSSTNGYYGSYLDLYLKEFISNLQWYLDNLDYAEGWTWFDDDGSALSDSEVSNMSTSDKATAFIKGNYSKGSSSSSGGAPSGGPGDNGPSFADSEVGTPSSGTTQSAGSNVDSANYSTYDEMLVAYIEDIEEVLEGDKYGNNIVNLYNPLNYIDNEDTSNPTWVRIMMGASEGDISMFNSLNLEIAMLNAGIDANIEWQWDGGHVPDEILSESFSLYVDQMYGEHVNSNTIETPKASTQTSNGSSSSPSGTDISSWVNYEDISNVSFSLSDIASYRTDEAAKAMPRFDVIDYGQEDYVFGSSSKDARHWDSFLLTIFNEHQEELSPLFNNN